MNLKTLTDGQVAGTATIQCKASKFGGALIKADGTNAVTVTVKNDSSGGDTIFQYVTATPAVVILPIDCNNSIYYSITGTNGAAQLFEWIDQ